MRNILVHPVVRTASRGEIVESVHLEGHAFGLTRVRVTIIVGDARRSNDVDVDAASHWTAHFSLAQDHPTDRWRRGTHACVVAADPDDPDGCYSSIEASLD